MDFPLPETIFHPLRLKEGGEHIDFYDLDTIKQDLISDISDEDHDNFEVQLIDEVKNYECLYNNSHEKYNSISTRREIWNNISKTLNTSPLYCKKKWKLLRDMFTKKYRTKPKNITKWIYFDRLKFLFPYLRSNQLLIDKELNFENHEIDEEILRLSENKKESKNIVQDDKYELLKFQKTDFEVKLIEEVKQFEFIYNTNHENYSNIRIKNTAWEIISANLNCSSDICRRRWKNLRDTFNKVSSNTNWAHFNNLKFLLPYIKSKKDMINWNENENCENYEKFLEQEEEFENIFLYDLNIPETQETANDDIEVQHLIEEIKKYECIYNVFHRKNKCRATRRKAWHNISRTLNISEIYCKRKWKNLRDTFRSIAKNQTESEDVKWIYYKQLKFLLPYLKSKKAFDLLLTLENEEMVSENEIKSENNKSESYKSDIIKLTKTEFEIKLIEEIKKYEYIYNTKHENYRNHTIKNNAWENISTILNIPSIICKKRWKNIRTAFNSYNKLKKKTSWILFHSLKFLFPYLKSNENMITFNVNGNIKNFENSEECEEFEVDFNEAESERKKNAIDKKSLKSTFAFKLIEEIKKHECIYNIYNENYECEETLQEVWKNISESLNVSEEECKKQWNILKDTFNGYQHIKSENIKWIYFDHMKFLHSHDSEEFNSDDLILENEESFEIVKEEKKDYIQNEDTHIENSNLLFGKNRKTEKLTFKLIAEIQKYECIYNQNKPFHSKELCWNKVSKTLNISMKSCKRKWQNLRDTFNKFNKNKTKQKSAWIYYDSLKFLLPYTKNKKKNNWQSYIEQSLESTTEEEITEENSTELMEYESQETENILENIDDKPIYLESKENLKKCGEVFVSESTNYLIIYCSICNDPFFDITTFNDHIFNTHFESTDDIKKPSEPEVIESSIILDQSKLYEDDDFNSVNTIENLDISSDIFNKTNKIESNTSIPNSENLYNYSNKKCKLCGLEFPKHSKLNLHMYRNHPMEYTGTLHTCKFCNKQYYYKALYIEHLRLHTGERPFECKICNKKFISKTTLKNHKIHHSDIKPYACRIPGCNLSFNSYVCRVRHERIHRGEFPYQCDQCGKCFAISSGLHVHIKSAHVPIKDRPHKCLTCGHAFTERKELQYHMNIHTGEKPFACTKCDARFSKPSVLKQHQYLHTDFKRYKCKVCGERFAQCAGLSAHKKRNHKIFALEVS